MSVWKNSLLAGLVLSSFLVTRVPVQAAEREKERVLSVMQAVANAWNQGNIPASSYFEPSLTVVDNTSPYLFQGPDAVADWIKAYRNDQPKGSEDAKTSLHLLRPKTVEIRGARAYIAVPGDWTVRQYGQSKISHGVITAILHRLDQDWRISAWIWTPR
jgi:hypothetical protein